MPIGRRAQERACRVQRQPHTAQAGIVKLNRNEHSMSVQLDVRFRAAPNRLIIESIIGIGNTENEAINNSLQAFAMNSFHVIMAAFFRPDDQQAARENWTTGNTISKVTLGNLCGRGEFPNDPTFRDWFPLFKGLIETSSFSPGFHWIRLYYGHMKGKTLACEVLLDNEPWIAAQDALASYPWLKAEAFYSQRLFLILHTPAR